MDDPPPTDHITSETAAPSSSPSLPSARAVPSAPATVTATATPTTATLSAPLQVPAPAASAPPSTTFRLRRNPSRSERINDILETGRERAETMGGSLSVSRQRTGGSGGLDGASPPLLGRSADDDDDGPDERTSILDGPGGRGYQTTTAAGSATHTRMEPRSRRPVALPAAVLSTTTQARSSSNRVSDGSGSGDGAGAKATAPWYRTFAAQFRSIELENKGSVARDHLALERTFLAWLRTSLAFASIGIAVTQLFRLNTSLAGGDGGSQQETLRRLGKPLGATFLAISILILFLGYHRYIQSQQWVIRGKFPASRGTVMIVSFVAFAVMVASLVVVVVTHPTGS